MNTKDAEGTYAGGKWDDNTGFGAESYWDSNSVAWMWKRGLGCEIVNFTGDGVQGRDIAHGLGVAPNMMWLKNRTRTLGGGADWMVYVSGITHLSVYGSDPDNYGNNPPTLELNTTDQANFSMSGTWDHTHPTSTHFRVGDTYNTNQNGESIMAILFASIDKISKIGNYSGNGSSGQTISTGFQPRFLMIRRVDTASNWLILDTTRGWGSGDDKYMLLNGSGAQGDYEVGAPVSNGFTLVGDNDYNQNTKQYIYYAHA